MAQKLTSREKSLLLLCVGVLVLMALAIVVNDFMGRRKTALEQITALRNQKRENDSWMADREFWDKRRTWLEKTMPVTDSLGRAQGQLLEELQNQALDLGITIQQQTLPPQSTPNENYREVLVTLRLRGDQAMLMQWLSTMQSPELFQAVRALEIELDSRAREKTPQVLCNLTVARWFKPESGL